MSSSDLIRIVTKLHDSDWAERRNAASSVTQLIMDDLDDGSVSELVVTLGKLAGDANWQVRKAAIEALVHTGHQNALPAIEKFSEDNNHYVLATVKRGLKQIRKNMRPPKDKKIEAIFQALEAIDSKHVTKSELLDLAIMTGEKYYEELAADTAHTIKGRLNSLFSVITSLKDSLAKQDQTRQFQDLFEKIDTHGKGLLEVISDLATFTGPSVTSFQRVNLWGLLQTSLELAKNQAKLLCSDASISTDFDVDRDIIIECDPNRLEIAFVNLITNALEAMPETGRLIIIAMPYNKDNVIVKVVDTGCGMDVGQLERAFQRFKTTKRKPIGTGLGIPIAKKIVENEHNGRLEIESSHKYGTTVIVELPLRQGRNTR